MTIGRFKVVGLVFFLALAASATGGMSAAAETGGHFTHDGPTNHVTVIGTEAGSHGLEANNSGSEFLCKQDSYHGAVTVKTVESVTITPLWSECVTTGNGGSLNVIENGCKIKFTIGKDGQVESRHTFHIQCPPGKSIEIQHSCTMYVPSQTATGILYGTVVENSRHALTLGVALSITFHYENGICVFLGTTHTMHVAGSVTAEGRDTINNQVNITATTGPKL